MDSTPASPGPARRGAVDRPNPADGPSPAVRQPTLTLFCGLPGSGKTTLARQLEGRGDGVRLCTDDWQAEVGIPAEAVELHERLQRRLYQLALDLLDRGTDVILEDGLWTRGERAEKLADARARRARVVLHVLLAPVDVLWARLGARNAAGDGYPMTRAELDWAAGIFEPPTAAELAHFDEVHVVGDPLPGEP